MDFIYFFAILLFFLLIYGMAVGCPKLGGIR